MIPALALALSLFAQPAPAPEGQASAAEPAAAPAAADAPPQEAPYPAGAPHDDYLLVAWCYGALRGYVDLHDQVMPEVTRIETAFRPPDRKLSDDLKVYAELQTQAKKDLKRFRAALTAAEKASVRPINIAGGQAVTQGAKIWEVGPGVTKARLAEEWMSWTLPARCQTTADALTQRSVLAGAALKANEEPPPEAAPPPPADPPAADTPAAEKPAEAPPAADKPAEAPPAPESPK